MRIAHITLDEVNRSLVRRWARGAGVPLPPPVGAAALAADGAEGVLLDLDHLPADVRAGWVGRALGGAVGCPVLAHGHSLSDAEAAALRRRGVRVCPGRVRKAAVRGWLHALTRSAASVN